MRIMIKGGVWKNTEDEILKAAVMKYGKNQWARVASLLNRKTAKQCKARWYEWLDPSIKKTEWTRDEEEKLLHLAKLYPCQWRTIAPLVGRTAAQCMGRYERLLDEAQRDLSGETGKADANGTSAEEVRRLRPGEIDPTPETRPARPDPVDMDEDEKEMLSEARARLANTRGKKAKRKAREAQMDEAKRLASLQKRRELKAAGIYTSRFARRSGRKYVDYDAEVPFQKLAPAGFYDTTGEKRKDVSASRQRGDADFEAIRLDRFEEERRDAAEKKEMHSDKRKKQKLMKQNLPLAIEQLSRLNDPAAQLRRSELALPAPQVTDEELEEMARLGAAQSQAATTTTEGGGGSSTATLALLDQTTAEGAVERALAQQAVRHRTPLRSEDDATRQEARNAVLQREMQTPLLGQEGHSLAQGTGFQGATPMTTRGMPTPSGLSSRGGGGETPASMMMLTLTGGKGTPFSSRAGGAPTPLRDTLGLNHEDSVVGSSSHDFFDETSVATSTTRFSAVKRQRLEVKQGLSTLPEPKYAYEIEAPARKEEEEEEEEAVAAGTSGSVVDAAARDAARLREAAEEEARAFKRRSLAVQRDLPRPRGPPAVLGDNDGNDDDNGAATLLIAEEMARLLKRDAVDHPVRGASSSSKQPLTAIEVFGDDEVAAARRLIDAEAKSSSAAPPDDPEGLFAAKWTAAWEDACFFPASSAAVGPAATAHDGRWGTISNAPTAKAMVSAHKAEFEARRSQMAKGATRAARLEERVDAKLQPLVDSAQGLRDDIAEILAKLDSAAIEAACFDRLRKVEHIALPARLDKSKAAFQHAQHREKSLQTEYATLRDRYSALYATAAAGNDKGP